MECQVWVLGRFIWEESLFITSKGQARVSTWVTAPILCPKHKGPLPVPVSSLFSQQGARVLGWGWEVGVGAAPAMGQKEGLPGRPYTQGNIPSLPPAGGPEARAKQITDDPKVLWG